jgi:hypothetical protein
MLDNYDAYLAKKSNSIKIEEKIIVAAKPILAESTKKIEPKPAKVITEQVTIEEVIEGYKLYRDKTETFKCDLEITGADKSKSSARVIIESNDMKYIFEGSIDENGHCEIKLPKMDFINEKSSGIINLEVIADDTLFKPWSEKFTAVTSKNVTVKSNNIK